MKRALTVVMMIAMLSSIFPALSSVAMDSDSCSIGEFSANVCDLTIDETHEVTFCATVSQGKRPLCAMELCDESGSDVAKLYDNGKNGDKIRGDGIYSANVALKSSKRETKTYYVVLNGKKLANWDIVFYELATAEDMKIHDCLWEKLERMEGTADSRKLSNESIISALYDTVVDSDHVESINWEGEYSFSFTLDSGITGSYTRWNATARGAESLTQYECSQDNFVNSDVADDYATWTDPDFVVFRPYRNTPSAGSFSNEFYTGIANNVCKLTGGTVTDYIENQAYPGNLINVSDYGFFVVDSHGTIASGKSYMMMRKGDTSNYEYQADLSAGHIISSGTNDVGVTGSFFTKYYTAQNKRLPDTMFYMVVCFGMTTTALYQPLIRLGAKLVVGYDESVSFTYDFNISRVVWNYMVTQHPDDSKRTYTFEEAMALSKQQCGDYDPYLSGRARMQFQGAGNFVVANVSKPVESVRISPDSCDMYINNTQQLELSIYPQEACDMTVSYFSDNVSVAQVDTKGRISAVSKGKATVTCKVVDISDAQNPKEFSATCTVNVLGALGVNGIYVEQNALSLYTNDVGKQINCNVLPQNATNQLIRFSSDKPEIAYVDDNGLVIGKSAGIAIITLTSDDGGYSSTVVCSVTAANFESAVNAKGGKLNIQNSTSYPWLLDFSDDRISISAGNTNTNASTSDITLQAGYLPVGTTLTFDRKVSSENCWDSMWFRVNGGASGEIPDTSGDTEWERVSYLVTVADEYTFTWGYTKDTSISGGADTAWLDNVDIIIPGQTHSVTFYDMDGQTVLSTQQVNHGSGAKAPVQPNHTGYEFVGWDVEFDEIRTDTSVRAVCVESSTEYFTVTFVDRTGNIIATVQVVSGQCAQAPQAPAIDGYVFIGWDGDISKVMHDMTVTAQYAMLGDANLDKILNTGDAVVILKYTVDNVEFSYIQKLAADFNKTGDVNVGDASAILVQVTNTQA